MVYRSPESWRRLPGHIRAWHYCGEQMSRNRLLERLTEYLDPIDVLFGFLPGITAYAAFTQWASLIVRAIRGEEAKEDWRVVTSTVALIVTRTLVAGAHVRETAALRGAAVEMRGLVAEASEDARRREQIAIEGDQRDASRQEHLLRLTKWLVGLAALTLAAAIVTLAVAIIGE